jgi:hypothetical protein
MRVADDFGGDDERSMLADNTSAFNCRLVPGTRVWSQHAYGLAVDINPFENPEIQDGQAAPPAAAAWALNARAAGEVTLRRGRHSQRYTVTEPGPSAAVPVLRRYMAQIRVTRAYFDAAPDSPDDAVKAELPTHPVFELTPVSPHRP